MIRNNQNGRRRGRGGARPPQQGGGPSGNYGNANGGGSRIDTRQRGNATQLLEKYKAMARDATQNGDRVQAEFYMQYADHYFRVLNEFRARDPQPAPRPSYDDDDDGYGAPGVGQNYAPASERYDDDGDDAAPAGGNERPAYRANGEPPRGNDGYAGNDRGREPRHDRDTRDGGQQRGYAPRQAADDGRSATGDVGRNDAPRGNARNDDPRRDDGGSEAPRRAEGRTDSFRPAEPVATARRDDGRNGAARGDAPRRDNGRDTEREPARREVAPRYSAPREPVAEPVMGLPGPATLAPTFAPAPVATPEPAVAAAPVAPVVATVDGEVPVRRPRGRPRKVVVADSAES